MRLQVIEIDIDVGEVSVRGYQPKVTYTFPFGEGIVQSTTLCLDPMAYQFHHYSEARKFLAAYVVGATINVLVSPSGDSVFLNKLDRKRTGHYWAVFFSGVVVVLLGYLLVASRWQ